MFLGGGEQQADMAQRTPAARDGDQPARTVPRQGDRRHRVDGDRAICPLCGVETADARALYTHLQTGHRKSTLAGIVLRG